MSHKETETEKKDKYVPLFTKPLKLRRLNEDLVSFDEVDQAYMEETHREKDKFDEISAESLHIVPEAPRKVVAIEK